ncbi:DMT family transporter [Halovivax limisalsi]|uniref:DMT family transporter n=1 Tax=Halovivax limisalsi TaxID=1453760 RepID=UPI001FFCC734|nr:DMT family transporter [Halovivax limisalsi]
MSGHRADDRDWDEHDPSEPHDERRRNGDAVTRDDSIEHRPNPGGAGRSPSVVVALLGAFLVGLALGVDVDPGWAASLGIVGAGLLAAGAYNAYRQSNGELGSVGVATLAAILAGWLVVAVALLGADSTAIGEWLILVAGAIAFLTSAASAIAIRSRRRAADPRPTAVYDRRGQ